MSQSPYYVEISPNEYIMFDDTSKNGSTAYLQMKNLTSTRVAYKIRTTTPKGYTVKPNSGVIPGKETKKIEFSLHASDDGGARRSNQDKFLIMAVPIEDNFDLSKLSEIWKQKSQESIQNLKLEASFKGAQLSKSTHLGDKNFDSQFQSQRNTHDGEIIRNNQKDEILRKSVPVSRQSAGMYQSTMSPDRHGGHDFDKLEAKLVEQDKQITKLTEERNQFFNELSTLKETLEKNKGKGNYSTYQLWHILLVAVISLIIGAFLSADRKNFSTGL